METKLTKLEIKHLAPYLPYGLVFLRDEHNWKNGDYTETWRQESLLGCNTLRDWVNGSYYENPMPILRPLTDLTNEIDDNGEKFVPIVELFNTGMRVIKVYDERKHYCVAYGEDNNPVVFKVSKEILSEPYYHVQKLFEWKFDVFNLTEKGLAVDINTLPDKPYR